MKYDTYFISDNKPFPNNRLPVILYTEIFHEEKEDYGDDFLHLFRENGWGNFPVPAGNVSVWVPEQVKKF